MSRPARVTLVGVNGHGRKHLAAIVAAEAAGRAQFVAAVDPQPAGFLAVPTYARLEDALAEQESDVVVIVAPIGEHTELGTTALEAGADLLLEKPPTASLADFRALEALARRRGRAVQVGFQALGSGGVDVLRSALREGVVGDDPRVVAWGEWRRTDGYFARNAWAGRRVLDGRRVADGVVTNVLAHTVSTALAVTGTTREDQVAWVETELYRAHDITTDDTAWVEVATASGVPVRAAVTLCGSGQAEEPPWVALVGSRGRVVFRYTLDELVWEIDGDSTAQRVFRSGLLDNLLQHRERGVPLVAPLSDAGAFMCVLEAVQASPPPTRVSDDQLVWRGIGASRTPEIVGIADALRESLAAGRSFSGIGVPWATARPVKWVR